MTYDEYKKMFETDEGDRFVHLVIPAQGNEPELDVSGKKMIDMEIQTIVRIKKYSAKVFEEVNF